MDVMMTIYNALMADEYIKQQATGRIKFYEYPATGDVSGPYIVIDPLSPPLPDAYGDNEPIADSYIYQIDVWTKSRTVTKEIAKRVGKIMRDLGYGYFAGGVDEWDKDTGIYRDARRYRNTIYDVALI
ncbi:MULTISPECIES: hypothetical protein [unclassified Sporosarcina]|uniref:hypothetical protein n=1 Tax=unclassified Sporosarcina TaxID=2647733 RepID=UPI00203E136C|nr:MULTISPECIES: hypothetical protein [unclassified Sporosarcina]GKV67502.1 hypothetical protein NCCP2331_36550 [Sporosarcina sp. NCCP-2331]GLB57866.1 hypothetical protein NCCP2378_36610 [Sporosarcina sp. NCCP-2378]